MIKISSMVRLPSMGTSRSVPLRGVAILERCHTPSLGKPSEGQLSPECSQGQGLVPSGNASREQAELGSGRSVEESLAGGVARGDPEGRELLRWAQGWQSTVQWIHCTGTSTLPTAVEV